MVDIKVSVIVPVFKVERFVERCMRSLLSQTLDNVEYIIVNDASPDRSIDIIKRVCLEYPNRLVTFINHDQNKGLPSARNTGLKAANGEYIFHCDSDDYVDPTMLEDLYNAATENDSDIVWCDWYLTLSQSERYMVQPSLSTPLDAVKAMLCGKMKFNVWNKLIKRQLYTNSGVSFPDGYGMAEDMTIIMLFAFANRVEYLPKAYYHYIKTNSTAFSQTYSERHLVELQYNIDRIESFIHEKFGQQLDRELSILKLEAKYPFLLSNNTERIKLWNTWYPESNRFILDNTFSFHRKIPQVFAKYHAYFLVRAYSIVFNRIIYGMFYR